MYILLMTISTTSVSTAPRSRAATVRLPSDWRPVIPAPSTAPKAPSPSKAMRDFGRSVTEPMPVIGRAGSREWARNAAPCFGGGEVR